MKRESRVTREIKSIGWQPLGLAVLLLANAAPLRAADSDQPPQGASITDDAPTAELRMVTEQPLSVGGAIEVALRDNPELLAARRGVAAAEERIRPAGALSDPEIEVTVSDLGMDGGARKSELMVRQMFDWPGKRSLMREEMRAMAGMSAQETVELELELAARVREAFWDLHRLRENLDLSEKTLKVMQDFVQISEARYAAGAGIQQDVLRAQAEVFKLEARLAEFRQEERARVAAINVLLGRSASEPLQIVLDTMVPPLPEDTAELIDEALAQRPVLRAMALEVHRQEVRGSIAKKDSLPDLELEAGVMRVSPSEIPAAENTLAQDLEPAMTEMPADMAFSFGVMATIPLWKGSKQDHRVAESHQAREAAAAKLEASRLEVGLEVHTLIDQSVRLREQIRTYQDEILPRDRQAVSSALESYEVGAADFLTLLSGQIATLDDEIELHRLHSLYNKSLARLDRAVGRSPSNGQTGRAARAAASDASGTPTVKEPGNTDVQ